MNFEKDFVIAKHPFRYSDNGVIKNNIEEIAMKVDKLRIAIIGLGGTGAFILDYISKTYVKEIHLFDDDWFESHNAFRSPGVASCAEVDGTVRKVKYFEKIYNVLRDGIVSHPVRIDNSNIDELEGFDFVFISIDSSVSRKIIVDYLVKNNILFIDVGMGLSICNDNEIRGQVRVTKRTSSNKEKLYESLSLEVDESHNDYETNIQIVELNALNASLAVIEWKKIFKIYSHTNKDTTSVFNLSSGVIINDSNT